MSLTSASIILVRGLKTVGELWDETRAGWSDAVAREKIDMTRALGATVEVLRTPEGKVHPGLVPQMRARVAEIVAETGAFWTDQFTNRHQLDGYAPLAAEVLRRVFGWRRPRPGLSLYLRLRAGYCVRSGTGETGVAG